MRFSRTGRRHVVEAWTGNVHPFYGWGFEFYHHRATAVIRHSPKVGLHVFLGPWRTEVSVAKRCL